MGKIAIPQLGDSVAPRFEAARTFQVAIADRGRIQSLTTIECGGSEGYQRVRTLQMHQVDFLICNGINGAYRDMLTGSGVAVASNVTGLVEHALQHFLEGKVVADRPESEDQIAPSRIPHHELITAARRLFESHGYQVEPGPGPEALLIDLVARIACPVCHRPVTVAVCCGSHTYRAAREIVEFHHATLSGYHARVYVCPASESLRNCCYEYGIQPVSPDPTVSATAPRSSKIPLLQGPITDHERATENPLA